MDRWRVEVLNDVVRAEVEALPKDIRARLTHIIELMAAAGPERMREPHVKHVRDKLWEMRMSGKMASHGHCMSWPRDGGS